MFPTSFQITSYLRYWLDAVDEHSLHSPFFFDLYTTVIRRQSEPLSVAENLRQKLLADKRVLAFTDPGSKAHVKGPRRVRDIAARSLSPVKYSSLYRRLVERCGHHTILELGTSFGINTLYLAAHPGTSVTTIEGSPEIASIAALTFEFAEARNVKLVAENIDTSLPQYLQTVRKIDFAFIDANHRYEPTCRYFRQIVNRVHDRSVIVIDDIHHSPEMEQAWHEARQHGLVYGSADLFRCGLLFFDPSLNKQHVILQF